MGGPGSGNKDIKPGKGRTDGSKNVKTLMWNELKEYLIGEGSERYLKFMSKLNDKDFANRYEKMLEYFKPKQQRTEIKADIKASGPKKIGFEDKDESES